MIFPRPNRRFSLALLLILLPLLTGLQSFHDRYAAAKAGYLGLKRSTFRQSLPQEWDRLIAQFRALLDERPPAYIAEVTSFTLGQVYYDKARSLKDPQSLRGALHYFHQVTTMFPHGPLADNAQFLSGDIYFFQLKDYPRAFQTYQYIEESYPDGDMADGAKARLRDLEKVYSGREAVAASSEPQPEVPNKVSAGHLAQVEGVRHWSNRAYTRVVVDLTGPVQYTKQRIGSPDRLFIDLWPAKLSPTIEKKPLPVDDSLLERVRFAENKPGVVRVVLDIKRLGDFKIFTLANPYRLTIDVHGDSTTATAPLKDIVIWGEGAKKHEPQPIRSIVLDPGHGGKDPGAVGRRGLEEKDVNLDIAKRLSRMLREAGVKVILTRDRDVFVSLEERTAIANINNADLFISIHQNAHRYRSAKGVETYFLNATEDEQILKVAARENNISISQMTVLEKILLDLNATDNATKSIPLANSVQETLVRFLSQRSQKVNNLGSKPGPFYVLVGAKMPAILVETSFISNPQEEAKLKTASHRKRIAEAVFQGIQQYARRHRVALQARR